MAITAVTFAGETQAENTAEAWTMGFTPSVNVDQLDSVTFTFDGDFDLSGVTIGSNITPPGMSDIQFGPEWGTGTFCYQVDSPAAGQIRTFLYSYDVSVLLAAGTPGTITIASGITNPAAGTYAAANFSVATNDEFAVSPSADVVITGSGGSSITRIPSIASVPSLPSVGGY